MSLFGKDSSDDVTKDGVSAVVLVDAQYREELKNIGREQFKKIIDQQTENLDKEMDEMMERVTVDLKIYINKRVDVLMGRLNADVTNQLNDRITEYNRVSSESQELVAQSLARNAQLVHEKYQQLSLNLQQAIANQEVMMATMFQDSKTQAASVQAEQTKILEQLKRTEAQTREEAELLTKDLRSSVSDQAVKLGAVFEENMAAVEKTRDTQAAMLSNLQKTTEQLEQHYQQLSELLEKSIAHQKEMVIETINENMARIIEHYLIGALGEQTNLREQLPSILQNMEESKQAMVDDMKL